MIFTVVVPVIVVSLIGAGLAAVLVVSERFVADYGTCRITINDDRQITVKGGKDLLSVLSAEKIFIPSACGGRGTCGLCKVKITEGAGPLLPTEEPYLDARERTSNVRLSCQIKIRNDLRVEIPRELLSIREYTCKCTDIIDLTYDMKQFRFELREPKKIEFTPGQYVQFLTPPYDKNREETYRAYSISSDPADESAIELIIRLVPGGICTTYCFDYLKVGDEVRLNGPYGDFRLSESNAPAVFIAGGSGMAPIKCMLHHMRNTACRRKAVYYFGANTVKDLFLTDLMREFESTLHDFKYIPVVAAPEPGDTWEGQTGLVTEAVERGVENAVEYEAYLCGSPGLIDAAVKVLTTLGMSDKAIFYDKFA